MLRVEEPDQRTYWSKIQSTNRPIDQPTNQPIDQPANLTYYCRRPPTTVLHTGLTRVSSIRFLLYEIKRVLVFNSIIIHFTDLFILYIFIQNAYADKKVFKKKG